MLKNQIIDTRFGLNHPSVQNVLKIAERIIEHNKTLNTKNLYDIAKNELNIPKKGLLKIITYLLNNNILIEGSKYTRESVLNNTNRVKVLKFIENNIGSHFSPLRDLLARDRKVDSGSSGQLLWHLEMLIKFNYIKKIKIGNYSVFIPVGLDEDKAKISFFLKDYISSKIIELLIKKKKVKQKNIYKLIGEQREKVYYRIENLLAFKIVEKKSRIKVLFIPLDKRKIILNVYNIIIKKLQ